MITVADSPGDRSSLFKLSCKCNNDDNNRNVDLSGDVIVWEDEFFQLKLLLDRRNGNLFDLSNE